MKVSTLILILVAAGCGLVAAILVSTYGFGKGAEPPPAVDDRLDVIVAKKKLEPNTLVTDPEQLFEKTKLPQNQVTKDRLNAEDFLKLKGRTVKKVIEPGAAVADSDLYPPNYGITTKLKPGERPWALRVNDVTSTGGFIRPEDRVDVIATMERTGDLIAETIYQNIEVLAVDQDLQQRDNMVHKPSTLITLRVLPEQAEALTALSRVCVLTLVPRTAGDTKEVASGNRIMNSLKQKQTPTTNPLADSPPEDKSPEPAATPDAPKPVEPKSHTTTVVVGGSIQRFTTVPGSASGTSKGGNGNALPRAPDAQKPAPGVPPAAKPPEEKPATSKDR